MAVRSSEAFCSWVSSAPASSFGLSPANARIRAFAGDSPKELAGALLTHEQNASDDRTAIVLLIGGKAQV